MQKTLILLHGWKRDKNDLIQLKEYLSGCCKVVSFDMPGFGEEPLVDSNWGIPEYADWVNEKIKKEFGKEEVILLGYSFGGRIASYLASKRPKYLSALILYSSPSIYRPTNDIKFRINIYKVLKNILPKFLKSKFKSDDQLDAEGTALDKIFAKTVNFDQTEVLKNINVPTYIIIGEKDESVRKEIAVEMKELIPVSNLTIIPNATHAFHIENPTLFNAIIKNIISEINKNV